MTITLDHLVVYAVDHKKSAQGFANVMGLSLGRIAGIGYEFTAIRVNSELSIYFMDRDKICLEQHLAFHVDGQTFDQILNRLRENKIAFGSSPYQTNNLRTDHDFSPRGLFWTNLDGCLFEVMTHDL